ncbi:MAG: hypothetical protein EPN91_09110, partial [Salinibacterium sp.]
MTAPAFASDVADPTPTPVATQDPSAQFDATPTPTPTPTAMATRSTTTAAPQGYQDVTGYVTEVGDAVSPKSVKILDVRGYGYLSVDFSKVHLKGGPEKAVTVRLAVPPHAPIGKDGRVQFSALSSAVSPLLASGLVAPSSSSIGVDAMVNQTPAVSATHQVYAVTVTPANVCGSSCSITSGQSVANIQADVAAANSYWLSQSDGKVGFEFVGATAWYKSAYSCDVSNATNFTNLLNEARTKAIAQIGYTNTSNAHLVLIFPHASNCGSAVGLGTVGGSVNSGGGLWVVGSGHFGATEYPNEYHTLAHELGHNLSLGHADWLDCSSATPSPGRYSTNGCTINEYGDSADVMGSGDGTDAAGSLSSPQAIRSGMWSASSYAIAPVGTTPYVLQPLSSAAGLRSVVVEGTNGVNYFIEYRDTAGIDAPYATYGCPFITTALCTATTA